MEFVKSSVVHVYGKVAPLRWQRNDLLDEFLEFGHPNDDDGSILACKENIILMHDAKKQNPNKERAISFLKESEVVLFIGYGFDDYNNKLLDVELLPPRKLIPYCYTEETFNRLIEIQLIPEGASFRKISCSKFIRETLAKI